MARFSGTPIAAPSASPSSSGPRFGGKPLEQEPMVQPVAPQPTQPQFSDEYVKSLMRMENRPLARKPDDFVIQPKAAPEKGGGQDIGFGHKLTPEELQAGQVHGIPFNQGLTVAQAREVMLKDLEKHKGNAERVVGPEVFSGLDPKTQELLTDYSYNGVLEKFPKFTQALIAGDYDTAEKEYVRYMTQADGSKVPLGNRNTWTLAQLQQIREGNQPQKSGPSFGPQTAVAQTPEAAPTVEPAVEETPIRDFLRDANPLGAVEGLGSVATGMLGGLTGTAVGAGEVLKGLMAGDPVAGFASAQEEFEKVMEATTYQSKTPGGQKIAEYVAMPFMEAEKGIEAKVREAGGGDKEVNAALFAFNAGLFGLPFVSAKFKKGQKLSKEEVKQVKEEAAKVDPEVDVAILDEVLEKAKDVPDLEVQPRVAKVESNQYVVDKLLKDAAARPKGRRRQNYEDAAKKVAEADVDAADMDLGVISKREGKTRRRIKELVGEREKQATSEVPVESVPEGTSPEAAPAPRFSGTPVDPAVAMGRTGAGLVEPTFSRRNAVGKKGEAEMVEGPKEPVVETPKVDDATRAEVQERIQKAFEEKRRQKEAEQQEKAKVEEPLPTEELLDDPLAKLEEEGPSLEELSREENLLAEDLRNLDEELKALEEGSDAKAQRKQLLMETHKKWKDSYVEKINAATPRETGGPVVKKESLAAFDDNFKTFKSKEDAEAYKLANDDPREVLTDPMTGESYLEPVLMEMDDFAWDREPDLPGRRDWDSIDDGYEGGADYDLSDTGTLNLWQILNNESGSVPLPDLQITTAKLKEIKAKAQRVGKEVDAFLDMIGVDPETAQKILVAIDGIAKNEETLRELDPINEGIFNPQGEVLYQRARKGRKETVLTQPAITKDMAGRLLGAKKIEPGSRTLGKFLDAFEIRANTFERFGKGLKGEFYDKWITKAAEAKREFRGARQELRQDMKEFSKREREEMSIVAHSRQKGGLEALQAMGITEVPKLTARQEAAVQKYQGKLGQLLDRINYVRSNIGLQPIGKLDNYFPMIHKINHLKNAGIIDNGLGMNLTNFAGHSKKFNGNFFPFEKTRKGKKSAIELDIFDAYEMYAKGAMKEIHVNPIAALAKEAAGLKIGRGKSSVKLAGTNPMLHKLLLEWSDEILGIDPITRGLNAKYPELVPWFNKKMENIVTATLFGRTTTVAKQPLALIGVWADTTSFDTLSGIAKVMTGRAKDSKRSNVIEVRSMDLMIDDMASNISKKGVRAGIMDNAKMAAAWPMTFVDALTASAGWEAAYGFAKRKMKLSEKEAFQYAEDLVTRTQGVGVRGAVAPIQTVQSLKWLTMFQTFAINDFNYIARDVLGIRHPNINRPKQVSRVLKYVAGGVLANTAFELIGMDSPRPAPVEAYKESKEEGMRDVTASAMALKELLEVVPIIGGAVKYGSNLFGPAGELAKDVPESLKAVSKLTEWGSMTRGQKIQSGLLIGETLGLWYGIPMTTQLKASIRAASREGNPYEVIMGLYVEEAKKRGMPDLGLGLGGGMPTLGLD